MKMLNFFLFAVIYFAASLVLTGNQYIPLSSTLLYTRYIIIIVIFAIITLIYLYKNGFNFYRFSSYLAMYLFMIWLAFSAAVLLSELVHNTFPNQGLFFLLVVPFIYFTVMPYMTKVYGQVIHSSLFTANLAYLLISYLTVPFIIPYSGIAANTNGFGQLAAIGFITGFFCLVTLPKGKTLSKMFIIATLFLMLFSVFVSFSRTSFLVLGMITFLIVVQFLGVRKNFKPLFVIVAAGLIVWFTPLKETLLSGLVDKFTSLSEQGDFLHGRFDTWVRVIEESNLFGHGEDYFQHFFEGAHNSIIYILGVYGIIPALLLSTFLLFAVLLAFIYAIRNQRERFAIFPFVIIVTFTLFSMTEAMFGLVGNGITIAFYQMVGMLIFNMETKTAKQNTA